MSLHPAQGGPRALSLRAGALQAPWAPAANVARVRVAKALDGFQPTATRGLRDLAKPLGLGSSTESGDEIRLCQVS